MKRLTARHKTWLERHARLNQRNKLRRRKILKLRRLGLAEEKTWGVDLPPGVRMKNPRGTRPILEIDVPKKLSLSTNYEEVMTFFERLREFAKPFRHRIVLQFVTIESISPGATLMLAAELDRWRRRYDFRLRPLRFDKWNPAVRRHLYQMGLFELLGVPPGLAPAMGDLTSGPVELIRFRSGELADGALAAELRAAIEGVAGNISEELRSRLFEALTEAMTNVGQHAYPEDGNYAAPPCGKRWWMSGFFDRVEGRIGVSFFDQGVGIPATLPRVNLWERVRGYLAEWSAPVDDHSALIRAAVTARRTQAEESGRGHGLEDVRRFVDAGNDGRLRILSGRGEYVYHRGGGEEVFRHSSSIGGTLIQWDFSRPN